MVQDWDGFLRLAEHHGMLPQVFVVARDFAEQLPSEVLSRAAAVYAANSRRNLRFTAELLHVATALQELAIPVMPLKGPALAEDLYGDLAQRQFSDLDILVPPHHLASAAGLLARLGYESLLPPDIDFARLARTHHHLTFHHARKGTHLELHWTPTGPKYGFGLSVEEAFGPARKLSLLGRELPVLALDDLFLYLCVHAEAHLWSRLEDLRCLAELAGRDGIEPLHLLRQAGERGCRRRFLVAVLLLDEVADLSWDETLLAQARADGGAVHLAREAAACLAAGTKPAAWPFYALRSLRSLDGHRQRARYVRCVLVEPQPADWAGLNLPVALYPAYYVTRPLRLSAKYGAQALRRASSRAGALPCASSRAGRTLGRASGHDPDGAGGRTSADRADRDRRGRR
jgi:hypothetical protein